MQQGKGRWNWKRIKVTIFVETCHVSCKVGLDI